MKEPLKDRIDILIEEARSGDSVAQLELAKCFLNGRFVEKSIDQARYWAFKAVSSGNDLAQTFYMSLY